MEKIIKVKLSSIVDPGFGCWLYNHYCLFPNSHPTHRYDVRASLEGFAAMTQIWKEAGYSIEYENEYPK